MNNKLFFKYTISAVALFLLVTFLIVYDFYNSSEKSSNSIYFVPFFLFIALIYFWFIFKKSVNSYYETLKELDDSLKNNIEGKFQLIKNVDNKLGNKTEDLENIVNNYNHLIENFKETTMDIDSKLKGFIGNSNVNAHNNNSLKNTKEIISNLSNLYQFKKQIELDKSKEEIFGRLSQIFINKFELKNFTIFEILKKSEKINIIQSVGNSFVCEKHLSKNPLDCRCSRIAKDVHYIDYHKSCPFFDDEKRFFYCVNMSISQHRDVVFNFVVNTKEELEKLKNDILFIKAFINEAIPSIEVKVLMQALKDSAFTDNLTGLYNRTFLEEHSTKLIPQAKRDGKNIAVLLLDMDHFKAVNDEYGHDIGDKVLKEFSRILTENIRESDIAVRYGGEEFLVLLVDVKTVDDAYRVANNIREKVKNNEIDVYAGNKLKKTISIGLAMYPQNGQTLDGVIKNADIALYEAKNSGRDSVVIFDESQVSSIDLF